MARSATGSSTTRSWTRRRRSSWQDDRFARLDDSAILLHACMHAVLGGSSPTLLQLRDVAQLSRRDGLRMGRACSPRPALAPSGGRGSSDRTRGTASRRAGALGRAARTPRFVASDDARRASAPRMRSEGAPRAEGRWHRCERSRGSEPRRPTRELWCSRGASSWKRARVGRIDRLRRAMARAARMGDGSAPMIFEGRERSV